MCASPYDCDYPAFGGATPRTDRSFGRVGSLFSDAGGSAYVEGEQFGSVPVEAYDGDVFEPGVIVQEGDGQPLLAEPQGMEDTGSDGLEATEPDALEFDLEPVPTDDLL